MHTNHIEIQVTLKPGEKWPLDVWEIHCLTTQQIQEADLIIVYKNGKNSQKFRIYKDRAGTHS